MANVEARGCSAKLWDPGSPGWQWGTAVGLFYSLSIPWHTGPSLLLGCSLFICHPTCFPSRLSAVLMMPELRSLCGLGAALSLVGLLLIASPIPRAPRPKWTCLVPSSCWQPGQWLFFQGQKAVLCLCPVAHAPGAWAVRQQCSAFPTPNTQASQLVVATQVFAAPLPREESVSRRTLSSSLDGN